MVQAAVLDCFLFEASPFSQDGFAVTEIDVGCGQVADAFVVTVVVVMVDEGRDGGLKLPFEEVVFEENAVLQGLVPAFDFVLGLRMHRGAANIFHALALEVFFVCACSLTGNSPRVWPSGKPGACVDAPCLASVIFDFLRGLRSDVCQAFECGLP